MKEVIKDIEKEISYNEDLIKENMDRIKYWKEQIDKANRDNLSRMNKIGEMEKALQILKNSQYHGTQQ